MPVRPKVLVKSNALCYIFTKARFFYIKWGLVQAKAWSSRGGGNCTCARGEPGVQGSLGVNSLSEK
jgi:hypothetical protein